MPVAPGVQDRDVRAARFDRLDLAVWLLVASLLVVRVVDLDRYLGLVAEDGLVEWLTALFFGAAAFGAFRLARILRRSERSAVPVLVWSALAIVFVVLGLDEISWGQRVFDFGTPQVIARENVQSEISIHNLKPIQAVLDWPYMLVGLYGMFSWLALRPLLRSRTATRLRLDHLIVPARYAWLFVPLFAQALWWHFLFLRWSETFRWVLQEDEELAEMLFALGRVMNIRYQRLVGRRRTST